MSNRVWKSVWDIPPNVWVEDSDKYVNWAIFHEGLWYIRWGTGGNEAFLTTDEAERKLTGPFTEKSTR